MAESPYLELPPVGHPGRWGGRRPLILLLVALLLLVGGGLVWWMYTGRVASVAGRVDGMVHVVAPRFSGRLASLDVKEGDSVVPGQPVGRMETGAYDRHLAQAAAEAAALRPPQGPDMVESAARLRQAQEAERDFAVRLAQARHEEEALRDLREERVTEHVRAQLALRSLDSQGGERTAGAQKYAAAREAEVVARNRKEAAAADFERASLMRASVEQELGRIRREVMAARNHASRQRQVGVPAAPDSLGAEGALFAPVGGTVLRRLVEPGETLQAGEPALLIAPAGKSADDAFWVEAWFPASDGGSIRAGQHCRVTVGDTNLSGTVLEVAPPQPLPEGIGATPGTGAENAASLRRAVAYLPVRIALGGDLPRGFTPGAPAECVVMTHGFPF